MNTIKSRYKILLGTKLQRHIQSKTPCIGLEIGYWKLVLRGCCLSAAIGCLHFPFRTFRIEFFFPFGFVSASAARWNRNITEKQKKRKEAKARRKRAASLPVPPIGGSVHRGCTRGGSNRSFLGVKKLCPLMAAVRCLQGAPTWWGVRDLRRFTTL